VGKYNRSLSKNTALEAKLNNTDNEVSFKRIDIRKMQQIREKMRQDTIQKRKDLTVEQVCVCVCVGLLGLLLPLSLLCVHLHIEL